jgi:hypothetical protein
MILSQKRIFLLLVGNAGPSDGMIDGLKLHSSRGGACHIPGYRAFYEQWRGHFSSAARCGHPGAGQETCGCAAPVCRELTDFEEVWGRCMHGVPFRDADRPPA